MNVTNVLIRRGARRSVRDLDRLAPRTLDSYEKIRAALEEQDPDDLWLLVHRELLTLLCRALARRPAASRGPTLWVRFRTGPEQLAALTAGFSRILPNPEAALGGAELAEVLHARHPEDYVVAAHHYAREDQLVLWRGDFSTLLVPLSTLRERAHRRFNARKLRITDFGRTLAFGTYEVSVDAILYERDPAYRRRANARRRDQDTSFGGCLRRLRILRGVGRDEFPGLSSKTIARIERGEVEKPHARTLRTLAEVLDVKPGEIESY